MKYVQLTLPILRMTNLKVPTIWHRFYIVFHPLPIRLPVIIYRKFDQAIWHSRRSPLSTISPSVSILFYQGAKKHGYINIQLMPFQIQWIHVMRTSEFLWLIESISYRAIVWHSYTVWFKQLCWQRCPHFSNKQQTLLFYPQKFGFSPTGHPSAHKDTTYFLNAKTFLSPT